MVRLAASCESPTTNVVWDINPPFGMFSNDTSPTSTYTLAPQDITNGSVILTVRTNDPPGLCQSNSDDMSILVEQAPTVDTGAEIFACQTDTTFPPLAGSIGGGASGTTWSGGSGTFVPNAQTLNATYVPSAAELAGAATVMLTLTSNDPARSACSRTIRAQPRPTSRRHKTCPPDR